MRELLAEMQAAIEPQLDGQTELRIEPVGDTLRVLANKDALKGALLNLVTNAIQACGAGARVAVGTYIGDRTVTFTVSDNGPGIPEEILPRVFEPFFTTRPQGTGLGLAVVKTVAATHGGSVEVDSTESGASFSISLPADAAATGATP